MFEINKVDKDKIKKNILILGAIIIFLIFICVIIKQNNDSEIKKYAIVSTGSPVFGFETKFTQYYIDSKKEVDQFYRINGKGIKINKGVLRNKILFINIGGVSSGSIKVKLKSVKITPDDVKFKIKENNGGMGTLVVRYWYTVAEIPKNKIKNNRLKSWKKPSEIMKTIYDYDSKVDRFFSLDDPNNYEIEIQTWKKYTDVSINKAISYQIDFKGQRIGKIEEIRKYYDDKPYVVKKRVVYRKSISENLSKELKKIIKKSAKNGINEKKYGDYAIRNKDDEKAIIDYNSKKNISNFFKKIDKM